MKKRVSLVLIFCLLLSLFAAPIEAATGQGDEAQTGLLTALGILEGEVDPNAPFTRGQLAEFADKMLGLQEIQPTEPEALFYDLASDHPYYGWIKAGVDYGLFVGYTDGRFRPDAAATIEQICSVFLKVAGYGDYAAMRGWRIAASDAGITDGVTGGMTVAMKDAIRLAFNTLLAENLNLVSVGGYGTEYDTEKGYTVLEHNLGVAYEDGVVNGATGTTLTVPDSTMQRGWIRIGDHKYTGGDSKMLGYRARVYYKATKDDSELREIVYAHILESKNSTLTIESKDLVGVSNRTITYEQDDRTYTETVSKDADVIYNGVAYPDYVDEDLFPANGSVTMIDNNNDGEYDVVAVEEREFMIVGSVNSETMTIYDKIDKSRAIKVANSKDAPFLNISRGYLSINTLSTLSAGSIISIQASKNTEGEMVTTIEMVSQKTNGALEGKSDDHIVLGNNNLLVSRKIAGLDYDNLKIGDVICVYIWNNMAVLIDEELVDDQQTAWQYAYLVAANSDSVFGDNLELKLVRKNRMFEILPVAQRVTIDGTLCRDGFEAMDALRAAAQSDSRHAVADLPFAQPIRFCLNFDGVINRIDTRVCNEAKEGPDSLHQDSKDDLIYFSRNNSLYLSSDKTALVATTTANTKVLFVPKVDRGVNESWYDVGTLASRMGNNTTYWAEVFNIDPETQIAKYIVVYDDVRTTATASDAAIVTKLSTVVDENGTETTQITALQNGNTITLKPGEDCAIPGNLKVGSLIRYRQNFNGQVTVITVDMTPDAVPATRTVLFENTGLREFDAGWRMVYGTVLSVDGAVITHTTAIPEDKGGERLSKDDVKAGLNNYLVTGNTRFYRYDSARGVVQQLSGASAITPYYRDSGNSPHVILWQRSGELRMVYVID